MIALAVGSVSIVESALFTVNATRVEGADGVQVPLTTQSYPLPAVTVSLVAVGVTLEVAVGVAVEVAVGVTLAVALDVAVEAALDVAVDVAVEVALEAAVEEDSADADAAAARAAARTRKRSGR